MVVVVCGGGVDVVDATATVASSTMCSLSLACSLSNERSHWSNLCFVVVVVCCRSLWTTWGARECHVHRLFIIP